MGILNLPFLITGAMQSDDLQLSAQEVELLG